MNTITDFCRKVLREYVYPLTDKNRELRLTLQLYLQNLGEVQATADQLFIHRKTVKDRIDKIEKNLGHKIVDPQFLLN